jgi:predicted dinucleotide-binding enzyme
VHWSRVNDVLKQAGSVSGKVIVSCSMPMTKDDSELAIAHTSSGAEALAKKVGDAAARRLVVLRRQPKGEAGRREVDS